MSGRQTYAPEARHHQYRFGDFTLDLDSGFLRRGADEITLRPKVFDALTYLVERSGRLVTKAELIGAIWPDAAVTDNSLAQCLLEIRRALGDDSQQIIRTVARRGYMFAAPVTTPALEFPRNPGEAPTAPAALPESPRPAASRRGRWNAVAAAVVVLAAVAGGILLVRSVRLSRHEISYTQLTDFTDSAVAPAVSPDGRMLAFIRGDSWFLSSDQVYVKMLPNGEARQLTDDPRQKYGVAFSPDGSKIAYTVFVGDGWKTYTTSPLGGEPGLLLANAAGLTWLDDDRLLFSELRAGMHMGIVTATANRSGRREVYFPQHERAMAHYSYASPDRRWALVIEMDQRPVWQPCRLVSLDGSSPAREVGPRGECTGAGWSPDGRWMYFTAAIDEGHHVWRQRFPDGEPEQVTFGPAQQDGIAVMHDGALVTSIGVDHSAVWIHDRAGDRPLSSEGTVVVDPFGSAKPSFSPDGNALHYLRESPGSARELWTADVKSGRNEPVLAGIAMGDYHVSSDGKDVVFSTQPADGKPSQIWLAPLDRSAPPRQISSDGESAPHFGPAGQVFFRFSENNANYVGRMNRDGSGRSKLVPYPISTIQNMSPDRRWLIAITPLSDSAKSSGSTAASMAVPTAGGAPRPICGAGRVCRCAWSPDGKFLYVSLEAGSRTSPGKTMAIPVPPETGLPDFPEAGVRSAEEALSIPGSRLLEQSEIIPGLDPSTYAYVKRAAQRNLFRIVLP